MEFDLLKHGRMATLTMVRTQCCQGYKQFGQRCSICPNRPENRQAVEKFKRECASGLGCQLDCERECGMKHPSALPVSLDLNISA